MGCIRSFTLKDGNRIREQLLTLDDKHFSSTYCIVAVPLPTALPMPTRRVVVKRDGDANQLAAEDAPCPAPAAGDVRIKQRAIGVNCLDIPPAIEDQTAAALLV